MVGLGKVTKAGSQAFNCSVMLRSVSDGVKEGVGELLLFTLLLSAAGAVAKAGALTPANEGYNCLKTIGNLKVVLDGVTASRIHDSGASGVLGSA